MIEIVTLDIAEKIAQQASKEKESVRHEFTEDTWDTLEVSLFEEWIADPLAWEVMKIEDRADNHAGLLLIWNCRPLDDQLRAYTYINFEDEVESILIVGE